MINHPDLWLSHFPFPKINQHKYDRGHVVVSGGDLECTGAACLAATAALRVGAGLVTVAAPINALAIYATKLTSVMAKSFLDIESFKELIADPRKNVLVLGPGNGVYPLTAEKVKIALALGKKCVIDADGLTVFADKPEELFAAIKSPVVFTPHEGEFHKIFRIKGTREEKAQKAAQHSGAIVVLKGPQTVIAAPDGRCILNENAPATLATAGTGDVLAGIIAGLMAQGMGAFEAACCGVWCHSKAAELAGMGMISEDLPKLLPAVFTALKSSTNP